MDWRIIYENPNGVAAVVIPSGEASLEEVIAKAVPPGTPYDVVSVEDIPSDRFFRSAWVINDGSIEHDLDKCKEIGHAIRRENRAKDFEPLDQIITKQLPDTDLNLVEEKRQEIRDYYAAMQVKIDSAITPEEIKQALQPTQNS